MSPEEITALFAAAATTFQRITHQPSDDDLTALRETLYPLLLEIPYDEAGSHNLIGLIEPTASYTATWGAAFPIPDRPPANPPVPDDASAVVRARREAEHAVRVRDFASYEAAERAAAKFIRDAVDEMWYRDLRHARSFYTNVSAKQLLDHLDANCGGLHPSELVRLPSDMLGYYTDADGIPEFITMLEDAQRKLARADLPMTDDQLLAIASTAVLASNDFPRATDDWEALPRAHKTWGAWKTHYRAAHLARKRQLLAAGTTMPHSGTAHAVTSDEATNPDPHASFQKLDTYLDNLASAASTDRGTFQQLLATNAALTANVTALTTSLATLSKSYAALSRTATATPTRRPVPAADNTRYCWTHGYRVSSTHTSATCTKRAEGHQVAATRSNTMGGSELNKPSGS